VKDGETSKPSSVDDRATRNTWRIVHLPALGGDVEVQGIPLKLLRKKMEKATRPGRGRLAASRILGAIEPSSTTPNATSSLMMQTIETASE
jgi:hypothetical protein